MLKKKPHLLKEQLIAGVLVSAYRNLTDKVGDDEIREAIKRGGSIPAGYCGLFGADGVAIACGNFELRIPFIERIDFALGFSLKSLRMLIFYDVGTYWKKGKEPQETLSSTGFGFRMLAAFLPIRIDIAYQEKWYTDNNLL